jgi:hypothetical protein
MALWNFLANPARNNSGNWTTNALAGEPEILAGAAPPYSRLSFRVTANGIRPGYKGPIGWMSVGVYDLPTSTALWFPGESGQLLPGTWYHVATQCGGLGDYIWAAPRAEWPLLSIGFWSNGAASGGTWEVRAYND